MEGKNPSLSGHGSSQGSHHYHYPTTAEVAMEVGEGQQVKPRPEPTTTTEDDTTMMKIVPIKATVVRKHSKQLPSIALLRKKSSDENMVDSPLSSSSPPPPPSASSSLFSSTLMTSGVSSSKLPSKPPRAATATAALTATTGATAALCSSLPEDLICKVTSFLDVSSLMQVRKCSRYLRDLASRNEAGWEHLCKRLWKTKVHVPSVPANTTTASTKLAPKYYMEAYHGSIQDAQVRQNLTLEELCYDPEKHTGTIWSFRFKESAGADWTTADPWHCGLPCRKMVFLKDGSVRQYIPRASAAASATTNTSANDSTTAEVSSRGATSRSSSRSSSEISDSESSLPELISPNFGNLVETSGDDNDNNLQHPANNNNNGRLIPPPLSMSWRLLTRPMDLPTRPMGSYVRFSVGGREVPTYSVRRSPTGNWGFVMESCWGVYASFDLPPKRRQQHRIGAGAGGGGGSDRRRLRRTDNGARWVEVLENGEETLTTSSQHHHSGSGGSRMSTQQQQDDDAALMDDASLVITNEIQWREAFLYNVGARVLPEGDDATDEFDRAFRGMP